MGCPYDPLTGRYRCPDEKTIRTVLDRLAPKALSRALLGKGRPTPRRARTGGRPSASVRDYRARRDKAAAKAVARARLAAVAVDGKTARRARCLSRPDNTTGGEGRVTASSMRSVAKEEAR
jgi:hypothetical protein